MKKLFKDITARLSQIEALKFIDEDFGQLEYFDQRPALLFPCALVTINFPKAQDLGAKMQQVTGQIIVRVGFNIKENTATSVAQVHRDKALAYYDLIEAVYEHLQGWSEAEFNKLSRVAQIKEKRRDGLTVVAFTFTTEFIDKGAAATTS